MWKLISTLAVAAILTLGAGAQHPALVFKRDRVIPVLATPIWEDVSITILKGTPSFDALMGYDTTDEQVGIGYQLVLNWKISATTTLFGGGAYFVLTGDFEGVRIEHLGDRIGLSVGAKLKF